MRFLGFDLTASVVKGNPDPAADDPGWFFVIQERPGEPRFGLDDLSDESPATPTNWNELAWEHLARLRDPGCVDFDVHVPDDSAITRCPTVSSSGGATRADMAYILYQVPVMVAFHAADMLPLSATMIDEIRKASRGGPRGGRRRVRAAEPRCARAELQLAALRRQGRRRRRAGRGARARDRDAERVGRATTAPASQSLNDRLRDAGRRIGSASSHRSSSSRDWTMRLPCVLFPLRIETRFMRRAGARELWVRVYPDDIAVHTHEKDADARRSRRRHRLLDHARGRRCDRRIADERERIEQGAWRALANAYGGTRAAWIAAEIRAARAGQAGESGSVLSSDPRADARPS